VNVISRGTVALRRAIAIIVVKVVRSHKGDRKNNHCGFVATI